MNHFGDAARRIVTSARARRGALKANRTERLINLFDDESWIASYASFGQAYVVLFQFSSFPRLSPFDFIMRRLTSAYL